jgi:hypothetical protein
MGFLTAFDRMTGCLIVVLYSNYKNRIKDGFTRFLTANYKRYLPRRV